MHIVTSTFRRLTLSIARLLIALGNFLLRIAGEGKKPTHDLSHQLQILQWRFDRLVKILASTGFDLDAEARQRIIDEFADETDEPAFNESATLQQRQNELNKPAKEPTLKSLRPANAPAHWLKHLEQLKEKIDESSPPTSPAPPQEQASKIAHNEMKDHEGRKNVSRTDASHDSDNEKSEQTMMPGGTKSPDSQDGFSDLQAQSQTTNNEFGQRQTEALKVRHESSIVHLPRHERPFAETLTSKSNDVAEVEHEVPNAPVPIGRQTPVVMRLGCPPTAPATDQTGRTNSIHSEDPPSPSLPSLRLREHRPVVQPKNGMAIAERSETENSTFKHREKSLCLVQENQTFVERDSAGAPIEGQFAAPEANSSSVELDNDNVSEQTRADLAIEPNSADPSAKRASNSQRATRKRQDKAQQRPSEPTVETTEMARGTEPARQPYFSSQARQLGLQQPWPEPPKSEIDDFQKQQNRERRRIRRQRRLVRLEQEQRGI